MDINAMIEYLKTNPSKLAELAEELEANVAKQSKKAEIARIQADIARYKHEMQQMNLAIGRTKQKVNMLERRLQKLTNARPASPLPTVASIHFIGKVCLTCILNALEDLGNGLWPVQDSQSVPNVADFSWRADLTEPMLQRILGKISHWPNLAGPVMIKTSKGVQIYMPE